MDAHHAAAPRYVPLTAVFLYLGQVTMRTRELAVSRMGLLEQLGRPQVPTYQDALAEWFGSPEYCAALDQCGMPNNEDVRLTLGGCDRWPAQVWRLNFDELPKQYLVDLYKLQVVPNTHA